MLALFVINALKYDTASLLLRASSGHIVPRK